MRKYFNIKDFSKFRTELGKVLEFINASDSVAKVKEILENNHEYYLHMNLLECERDGLCLYSQFGDNERGDIMERYEKWEKIMNIIMFTI